RAFVHTVTLRHFSLAQIPFWFRMSGWFFRHANQISVHEKKTSVSRPNTKACKRECRSLSENDIAAKKRIIFYGCSVVGKFSARSCSRCPRRPRRAFRLLCASPLLSLTASVAAARFRQPWSASPGDGFPQRSSFRLPGSPVFCTCPGARG